MHISQTKHRRESLTHSIKAINWRTKVMMDSLDQAIEDLKFFKNYPAVQWIYSVDFSLIYQYCFPPISQLIASLAIDTQRSTKILNQRQKGRTFYRNQLIELQGVIQHLFDNAEGRYFVILPPHQREMEHFKSVARNRLLDSAVALTSRSIDTELIKLLQDDIVKKIVVKVARGGEINDHDRESVHHLVQNKYVLLKGLVSMSYVGGVNTMNEICGHGRLIKLMTNEPDLNQIMQKTDERILAEQSLSTLWGHFVRLRSNPQMSWNNYVDALALHWINQVNQRFVEEGKEESKPKKMLILVSNAASMLDVARETDPHQPLYDLGLTSAVRHPETIFLLDKYREPCHPDGTIQVFEEMRRAAQKVVSNYSLDKQDVKKIESLTLLHHLWDRMEKLLDVLGFQINLKSFMDNINQYREGKSSFMRFARVDRRHHFLADSLVAVIKFFDREDNLQLLSKWKKNIEDSLLQSISDIEISKGLVVAGAMLSSAHYVFRCEFDDLASKLDREIFGEDVTYDFSKSQSAIDVRGRLAALQQLGLAIDKKNPHWEVLYLAAHVMEKAGTSQGVRALSRQYLEAYRLIEKGLFLGQKVEMEEERVECRKRFTFLKNIVLLREKKFAEAIKSAQNLCDEFGETSPRFAIQLGYIYWRLYREKQRRREGGGNDLRASIKAAEMAWEVKEQTEEQVFIRCRRLIAANLTSAYAYDGDLEKCSHWLDVMRNYIPKEENYGPINFHAVGSYYWLKVLKLGLKTTDRETLMNMHNKLSQAMNEADIDYQKEDFADLIAKIQEQINLLERQKQI